VGWAAKKRNKKIMMTEKNEPVGVLDSLDWERLRNGDRRALDPDHQWAFDKLADAVPAGTFEKLKEVLNQARCLERRTVGNVELANRIVSMLEKLGTPCAHAYTDLDPSLNAENYCIYCGKKP